MKKGLKAIKVIFICCIVGTIITIGILKVVDNFLYKMMQSSYLEIETYRTNNDIVLKQEDVIVVPDNATQVQYAYNNKYYAYLEDGAIHIFTTEDKKEYVTIKEDDPICYYYMLFDKNLILYFIEESNGYRTTLSLRTYEIATQRTTEYNDFNVTNFSRIKDITMSPLVNIIYVNVETKSGASTNNIVYKIDLFNSMSQVRSGSIYRSIRMLQYIDKLYYSDNAGGFYNAGTALNYLVGYADVKLIGMDKKDNIYLLDLDTLDKVYVLSSGSGGTKLINTIPLSDTDIVTTYCEYGGVYLIYPTYILDVSGANPYKRIAKLSKYVTFEAIKGDTVYLRTSNNKIITTTLLKNN